MSTLRTQKVTPLDGETNLILGDSGDTVTIPAGVTLAGSGASLTALSAANLTGSLPAISGASLTNLPGGGKVLQVVASESASTATTTSTTTESNTGNTVTITPSATSSKVLLYVSHPHIYTDVQSNRLHLYLYQDSTKINSLERFGELATGQHAFSMLRLFTTNTTSAVTWKTTMRMQTGNIGYANLYGGIMSMVAIEIGVQI